MCRIKSICVPCVGFSSNPCQDKRVVSRAGNAYRNNTRSVKSLGLDPSKNRRTNVLAGPPPITTVVQNSCTISCTINNIIYNIPPIVSFWFQRFIPVPGVDFPPGPSYFLRISSRLVLKYQLKYFSLQPCLDYGGHSYLCVCFSVFYSL